MTSELAYARQSIDTPEVQKLIQELGSFGLGVFIPHEHIDNEIRPLASGRVQLEGDQRVSFVDEDDASLEDAAIVGWRWDCGRAKVVAACACTPAHFPGHLMK